MTIKCAWVNCKYNSLEITEEMKKLIIDGNEISGSGTCNYKGDIELAIFDDSEDFLMCKQFEFRDIDVYEELEYYKNLTEQLQRKNVRLRGESNDLKYEIKILNSLNDEDELKAQALKIMKMIEE